MEFIQEPTKALINIASVIPEKKINLRNNLELNCGHNEEKMNWK